MIAGVFHQGSGVGNQLHRYVATRVLALDKGFDWGMGFVGDDPNKPAGFKGESFMKGDFWGKTPLIPLDQWHEKKIVDGRGIDIRGYDPEINFVKDNTVIDGEFQDERYWEHREKEVNEWLSVEPVDVPDDMCLIGFRGGEFSVFPDLFLTKEYWDDGIRIMREINPDMQFEVHTDDAKLAQEFFPDFKVIHDVGLNWRSMRHAKHAIISNSSFCILPRWLRNGVTIAPRGWGRRNISVWSLPQNYYKRFRYI